MAERYSLFSEGKNCRRITTAHRAAFLIDAESYYESLASVIDQAEKSVYIAAWDIDSRIHLRRSKGGKKQDADLETFLSRKVSKTPGLRIKILCWDFASIYILEREWLPFLSLTWKTQPQIDFRRDGENPIGASHHQKIVVVDDAVAFCGGIDLTQNRWDTPKHKIEEPLRKNPEGKFYMPFHDLMMLVDGDTARELGEIFRDRWFKATGETLFPPQHRSRDLWPQGAAIDLKEIGVAVARTYPAYKGRSEVREVENLYRDMIRSAKRYIYIENQYLTSDAIAGFLAESLNQTIGPEIVLVLPAKSNGWLEQSTMDAIRARVIERLSRNDRQNRLRIYYPALASGQNIYVHAKLMIADDRLVRIGSANLNNRSMGLDSECDLAAEAVDSDNSQAIAGLRNRLIAEHLDREPQEIQNVFSRTDSLINTIESLSTRSRGLKRLKIDYEFPVDGVSIAPDASFLDPESPVMIDRIIDRFFDRDEDQSRKLLFVKVFIILSLLLGLTAFWKWAPIGKWIDLDNILSWIETLKGSIYLPLGMIGAYALGGVFMVPITLMIGITSLLFSPFTGTLYALAGCILNALVTYGIGTLLGKNTLRKFIGKKTGKLMRYLQKQGIVSIALVRNLPIAPFSIVNIAAGAIGLKLRDYLFGTALGMLPGIVLIMIFTDRILVTLKDPSLLNIAVIAAAAIGIVLIFLWLKRRAIGRTSVKHLRTAR